jgi:hypothetical protein
MVGLHFLLEFIDDCRYLVHLCGGGGARQEHRRLSCQVEILSPLAAQWDN